MIWRKKGYNLYPDIILSDCTISGIQIKDNKLVLTFSDYGFIKKDKDNKYYRTEGAEIVVEGYEREELSIKELRTHQLSEEIYFDSIYDIEFEKFQENVNSGKWELEIVEEFYSTGRCLYICQIREDENCFEIYFKIRYRNLIYLWNSIRFDWPFN